MFVTRIEYEVAGLRSFGLSRRNSRGFTLLELLVVVGVIGVILALLLPSITVSRDSARRNACMANQRQIGVALQNHHNIRKCLPLLNSTDNNTATPVLFSPGSATTGYSWIVAILPYLGENALYNNLFNSSNAFKDLPFGPKPIMSDGGNVAPARGSKSLYAGQVAISSLRCPGYTGQSYTIGGGSIASGGAASTGAPGWNRTGYDASNNGVAGMYVSNYAATSAVNWACMTAGSKSTAIPPTFEPPNGAIVPPTSHFPNGRGITFRSITDGTSKTIAVAETREENLSAWIDGAVNWVVADWPMNPASSSMDANGYWTIGVDGSPMLASLNLGADPTAGRRYKNGYFGYAWNWGPSSAHEGGVVVHLYCDGGARFVTDDIDPSTYLQLFSRAGGEPMVPPLCE